MGNDEFIPCTECAEPIPAESTVCPRCGSPGPAAAAAEEPTEAVPAPDALPASRPMRPQPQLPDAALPPPGTAPSRKNGQIAFVAILFVALLFADRRVRDRVAALLPDGSGTREEAAPPADSAAVAMPAAASADAWIGQFVADSSWTDANYRTNRRYVALRADGSSYVTSGGSMTLLWQVLVDGRRSYEIRCNAAGLDASRVASPIPLQCTTAITFVDGSVQEYASSYSVVYDASTDGWRLPTPEGDIALHRMTASDAPAPDLEAAIGAINDSTDAGMDPATDAGQDPGTDGERSLKDGLRGARAPQPSGDQTYFDYQVERSVAPIPGTGAPRYPDILRSAGVEGEVVAQFVVDTEGRVQSGSFKVIRSSHELFEAAVRMALPEMRFAPAEIGGRKVKSLVQQTFAFALQR